MRWSQLTKYIKGGGDNASKFVNYVLRQVTQMKEAGTLPEPKAEGAITKADVLGIVHSQPTVCWRNDSKLLPNFGSLTWHTNVARRTAMLI